LEGSSKFISIKLRRDLTIFDGLVVLEYATSDLTARGVDAAHYAYCLMLSVEQRSLEYCGDYEQSAGLVHILPGENSGGFNINIMDDTCYEKNMEFIQAISLYSLY